jgi:SAM-dependent methyltransferase
MTSVTPPPMPYPTTTYHRRSVYALLAQHADKVKGKALHIGGPNDFWLLADTDSAIGLELVEGPGIDVVADACDLPFEDNTFDTILSVEVLEHVATPQKMVDEMYRVLKPGGTVLLSTPFVVRIHRTPNDYWRLTPDSLQMFFERYGAVDVLPVNGAKHVLMYILHQFGELFCDALHLPRKILYALKPIEWVAFRVIPTEKHRDRSWTTGWLVVAQK